MKKSNINDIEFIPSSVVKGLHYAPLFHSTGDWDDDAVGFSCLTRFEGNIRYPKLTLLGPVEYLDGEIRINEEVCSKGDYVRIEDGNVTGVAGPSGCLVLCSYKNGLKIMS
jgi:hypothetical protein